MKNLLEELVSGAELRAAALPPQSPMFRSRPDFRAAVAGRDQMHVIAEFKRCSPGRGDIRPYASVVELVTAYEEGGASAVSVVTEPTRFRGEDMDLQLAAAAVGLPIVLKDYVVSPIQVEHAAVLGASAVLLIVECLEYRQLLDLADVCRRLGLTPLVECHDERQIATGLQIEDAVLSISLPDPQHMAIDRGRDRRLLSVVPEDRVVVLETGVEDPEEIYNLQGFADAVLVGTALMCASDPRGFLTRAVYGDRRGGAA